MRMCGMACWMVWGVCDTLQLACLCDIMRVCHIRSHACTQCKRHLKALFSEEKLPMHCNELFQRSYEARDSVLTGAVD